MLTGVEVRTIQDNVLALSLDDPTSGFIIEEIDGLDPVKANVVSSSFATMDGEQYQSSRRSLRNIVMKLGLEPDWSTGSVRQLRNRLYDFFMPKSSVSLSFLSDDDDPNVDISGIVESFDAPLFTQDPTVSVSILCFDPDFYDPNILTYNGGTVATVDNIALTYTGTIEAGFIFSLMVNRPISDFTIYNIPPDGVERNMGFVASLVAGDVLEVCTIPGNKYVTLHRAGSDYSLLYSLSAFADWIQLFPGDNLFRVATSGATIPYTLQFLNKYGGL